MSYMQKFHNDEGRGPYPGRSIRILKFASLSITSNRHAKSETYSVNRHRPNHERVRKQAEARIVDLLFSSTPPAITPIPHA